MAIEMGENGRSVLWEPRDQNHKRRHGVVSKAMIEEKVGVIPF